MTRKSKSPILDFLRQSKGAVAVEFALIATVFFLLVAGVIDFGHAYYMKQTITNASREGARYGITYRTDSNGVRIAPDDITLLPSKTMYSKPRRKTAIRAASA